MPVPDNVLKLRECLEKLQIPGHFPHYNEAAFRNFKLKCTVHLNSGHFQPVSALCFGCCNYCILMRVIIDCWSQQMKINSLCISLMTSPTRSARLFFGHPLLPHNSNFYSQVYTVHLPICVRHPHILRAQARRFPSILAVRMRL